MPIDDAIAILKEKIPNRAVKAYAKIEDGYILILNDNFDTIGCNYYKVTNDKKVLPTNPALCKLNNYRIEML